MLHESELHTNDIIYLRTGPEKDKECEKDRHMDSS